MPAASLDSSISPPAQPRVVVSGRAADVDAEVLAVGFSNDHGDITIGLGADATLADLGVDPFTLLDRAGSEGAAGDIVIHELLPSAGGSGPSPYDAVVLVGVGAGRATDFRRAGAALVRAVGARGRVSTSLGTLADDEQLAALVEGLVLGGFHFTLKSGSARTTAGKTASRRAGAGSARKSAGLDGDAPTINLIEVGGRTRQHIVDDARIRAAASWRARTYALTPSNEKGPERLEAWAREATESGGLRLGVWDERRLEAEGFGGILAVGRGSAYASRFLRLDYAPKRGRRTAKHVVIVGKGITFDTGGISIKPRIAMETMKRDMTGAGVVIAVMGALRDLAVPVRVTGLVASAENAFGAASMRPGDVVTHYGGRTSEVGNTDAEGRLVLADALAYADQNIQADVVVDIATLTGAGKVALGTSMGALFANDDALAAALSEAGALAGEPLWRLPLSDQYEPLLKSPVADATNAAGGPGAVTAALFLQHFAGKTPWAHLDIASVGDSSRDAFEYTAGATGFGARLLLQWLSHA